MTTERDDARLRRYREASAKLDERPSPAARAAILAAAARHVEAKPLPAGEPRAPRRSRWPLAAAATLLLSSLAVMMATRTEQELPTFTPPAERAREQVAIAPAPPPPAGASGNAGPQQPAAPAPTAVPARPAPRSDADTAPAPAPMARLKKSAPSPAPLEEPAPMPPAAAERATSQSAESTGTAVGDRAAREPERASAEERRAVPTAPAAAAPPPPAIAPSSPPTAPAAGALGAAGASATGKTEASRFNEVPAPRDAAAAAKPRSERQEMATREVDRPAHEWLEQIVKLRSEGRHAEADAELKRFRERFPEVRVPPAALPPAGTR